MKCVACRLKKLVPVDLEAGLKALQCRSCRGQWLASQHYLRWLKQRTSGSIPSCCNSNSTKPTLVKHDELQKACDRQRAGHCPTCESILLRFEVSTKLDFRIEHCSGCNGIWLDAHKWEQLKALDFHTSLHQVPCASWQANLRRNRRQEMLESLYKHQFQESYPQLKQIKQWLSDQPQRDRMLDYLVHQISKKSS